MSKNIEKVLTEKNRFGIFDMHLRKRAIHTKKKVEKT